MSVIEISDEDIAYAELILLKKEDSFDPERVNFIKNLTTIDLQAVPGSGKTTAILAKLLILGRRMPFDDGAGLLVLSHTNAAVDEIKERIGTHCPHLFTYPNFVGTIQGFVDEFLAKPYYVHSCKKQITRICDQAYTQQVEKRMEICLPKEKSKTFTKVKYIYRNDPTKIKNFRFGTAVDKRELIERLNGDALGIKKPRPNTKGYVDYSDQEKKEILAYLYELKLTILKDGIAHFDDAYFLGERYLIKFPVIKSILQQRFQFVFVDEMQDMDVHQHDILEKLFYINSTSIYQRIGDRNQAIFNGDVKSTIVWNDRDLVLKISGSHRLPTEIAALVNDFSVNENVIVALSGEANLRPHMLVFKTGMEHGVINYYEKLIKDYQDKDLLPQTLHGNIFAISWVAKEKPDPTQLTLKSYYPEFKSEKVKQRIDHECLEDYLYNYPNGGLELKVLAKNIINAILKSIRLSGCKDSDGNFFTESSLTLFLERQSISSSNHEFLRKNLYQWCISIIRGKQSKVFAEIVTYIENLFSEHFEGFEPDKKFLTDRHQANSIEASSKTNLSEAAESRISINTVHSVKGQTHLATLYMETFNNGHFESTVLEKVFSGMSVTRLISQISKEIESLEEEIKNLTANGKKGAKTRENKIERLNRKISFLKVNAKMVYVGFSRATKFLGFAIEQSRYQNLTIDPKMWEIKFIET